MLLIAHRWKIWGVLATMAVGLAAGMKSSGVGGTNDWPFESGEQLLSSGWRKNAE